MVRSTRVGKAVLIGMVIILVLGVLYQVGVTIGRSIEPARQVWHAIGKPGSWRGVNFSAGQDFANYLEYLNQVIPQNAQVILPPDGIGPPAISRTPYMQFFLAPRQVANCTASTTPVSGETSPDRGEQCALQASKAGAYVLVVLKDQYPASLLTNPDQLHLYNQDLGVYFPSGAKYMPAPIQGNSSLLQIALRLLLPAAWLLVLTGSGYMMILLLTPQWRIFGRAAAGFGLGVGGFTLLLYIALLLGFRLNQALLFGLTLIWGCAGSTAMFLGRRARFRPGLPAGAEDSQDTRAQEDPVPGSRQRNWAELGYFLAFGGLAGLAAVLAVGLGYHWGDEVILWGVKGYGIAALGLSPGVSEWGTRTTSYPLNIPLLIAAFRSALGDSLPQSKIIFPLFYFSLLLLVYDFLRDLFPGQRGVHLAAWLTLAFAAAPLIFSHASWAYANLPLTFYLCAAAIAASRTLDPTPQMLATTDLRLKGLFLGGIFFMLAAWTRPDGLALSALAAACTTWFVLRRVEKGRRLVGVIALVAPLAGFALFWWSTAGLVYQQSGWSNSTIRAGLSQVLSGNANLENTWFVLRSFLAGFVNMQTWGVVGYSLVILVLLTPLLFYRRKSFNLMLVIGLGLSLAVLGLYILLANDPASNASWWVDTGLDRMLMPGLTILWLGLLHWVSEWLGEPFSFSSQTRSSAALPGDKSDAKFF